MYMVVASLILSIASIVIVFLLYRNTYRSINNLIEEFGLSLTTRKKYKRVKRYILAKVICSENIDVKKLGEDIERRVNGFLGWVIRMECGVTVLSFRPDINRAIFRVVGNSVCVKYVLLALSLQHLVAGGCIVIPLRTSGLLSRIKKFIEYRK